MNYNTLKKYISNTLCIPVLCIDLRFFVVAAVDIDTSNAREKTLNCILLKD
jgi:hypothetical protein